MLGTKSKPKKRVEPNLAKNANGSSGTGETCVITKGTVINGKFSASENIRLDGLIKGEVKCDSRLVMGEAGRIEGDVVARDAIIMGTIEGELRVAGTLTLKNKALVRGTITAKYLAVEEGGRYVGECKIGG